jgi:hypothetical protein|tara:strand:+ start:56 stop:256 length:201 start_codon:yes stop_codon:yes gene_type:complete
MSERKAGKMCNQIYALVDAKKRSYRDAYNMLDKLSPWMSYTQFCKYVDWSNMVRNNPHLLDMEVLA